MNSIGGDVLIVSAATGTGHRRAADAIQEGYRARYPGRAVEHVELLDLAPRWVRAAYGDAYELLATRAPWVWKQVYSRTDAHDGDLARWGPFAQRLLFREFRRLLLSRRWSACVCTHFLPTQLAAGGQGFPPFALVITDLTLHHFWAQPRVKRYFVGHPGLAAQLGARVPDASIDVTGIPISPRFMAAPGQGGARFSLGLDPRAPTVLVMGGGLGIGVEDTVRAVAAAGVSGLQIIAVTGRNEGAADALRRLDARGATLQVAGYVHDIERYIAAADLVVTKPGGLTTSESLAIGRPMLLTRPIPGQEEGNSVVLCRSGAAICAADGSTIAGTVGRLFHDRAELNAMTTAARVLGRPESTNRIVDAVEREFCSAAAA